MSWNYRVVTRLYPYPEGMNKFAGKTYRTFSVMECYYPNKKTNTPNGYAEHSNVLLHADSVADLKWVNKAVGEALKKPVIDLDNFPNTYKETKKRKSKRK